MAVEPDTGLITDCALTKVSGVDTHDSTVLLVSRYDVDLPDAIATCGAAAFLGKQDLDRAVLAGALHSEWVPRAAALGSFMIHM